MRTFLINFQLFVITFSLGVFNTYAQDDIFEKLQEIAIIDQKVMMPMRDGIRLATDIYSPKT